MIERYAGGEAVKGPCNTEEVRPGTGGFPPEVGSAEPPSTFTTSIGEDPQETLSGTQTHGVNVIPKEEAQEAAIGRAEVCVVTQTFWPWPWVGK